MCVKLPVPLLCEHNFFKKTSDRHNESEWGSFLYIASHGLEWWCFYGAFLTLTAPGAHSLCGRQKHEHFTQKKGCHSGLERRGVNDEMMRNVNRCTCVNFENLVLLRYVNCPVLQELHQQILTSRTLKQAHIASPKHSQFQLKVSRADVWIPLFATLAWGGKTCYVSIFSRNVTKGIKWPNTQKNQTGMFTWNEHGGEYSGRVQGSVPINITMCYIANLQAWYFVRWCLRSRWSVSIGEANDLESLSLERLNRSRSR